ncbi:unnamed protein product [Victoria cruziana]
MTIDWDIGESYEQCTVNAQLETRGKTYVYEQIVRRKSKPVKPSLPSFSSLLLYGALLLVFSLLLRLLQTFNQPENRDRTKRQKRGSLKLHQNQEADTAHRGFNSGIRDIRA